MSDVPFSHAVVMGSSIAGLLAARVLTDHFGHVTLIERDLLATTSAPRKGVPQGQHLHLLLARGLLTFERLFPGLVQELVEAGVVVIDGGRELAWNHRGEWRVSKDRELVTLSMTRPLLESRVADRIRALANLVLCDGTRVEVILPH